jgi:hypothetical protein
MGANAGAWAYPNIGNGDGSNSQFALVALHEAARAGFHVEDSTWQNALKYWKKMQNPADGSFAYLMPSNGSSSTGSMTCAGISSLAIASAGVESNELLADGGKLNCCADRKEFDCSGSIDRAFSWLGRRDVFSVDHNPFPTDKAPAGGRGELPWHFYYLRDLEVAGRLTGCRYVELHNWYREGTAYLCSHAVQRDDGSWHGSNVGENDPIVATAFALSFLANGRRPVAIGWLRYTPTDDEDFRPNAPANFTAYVERQWKKQYPTGLAWHVVDFDNATLADIQQAPVLFISGREAPLVGERKAKLIRQYIDGGGAILAEPGCGRDGDFDRGFRKLCQRVFGADGELRPLPSDHPVWKADATFPEANRPALLGIDVKSRTRVFYAPGSTINDRPASLACLWELNGGGIPATKSRTIRAAIEAADGTALNVLAYVTGGKLQFRDEAMSSNGDINSKIQSK